MKTKPKILVRIWIIDDLETEPKLNFQIRFRFYVYANL